MKEKSERDCVWCGKRVPNFRQERSTTCSKKCVMDYSHAGPKERERRFKLYKNSK